MISVPTLMTQEEQKDHEYKIKWDQAKEYAELVCELMDVCKSEFKKSNIENFNDTFNILRCIVEEFSDFMTLRLKNDFRNLSCIEFVKCLLEDEIRGIKRLIKNKKIIEIKFVGEIAAAA